MQYIFHEEASKESIKIRGEEYKYLFKVRRHKVDDIIEFRCKEDIENLYLYKVISVDAKAAHLELQETKKYLVQANTRLHLGWCVIDTKSIEKVLPSLNEMGVAKITFIQCDRSQKSFKIDEKRLGRIIESSSQQCGRSEMMQFDQVKDIESFLQMYPNTAVLDFCNEILSCEENIETVLIGCEGGFTENERTIFSKQRVFRLDTPMILRSESAALAIAAKVLL